MKALSLSAAVVDTTQGPGELGVTFTVTDDMSGAVYFEGTFTDASGVSRKSVSGRFEPSRTATFSAKLSFPRFSAPGAWTLSQVFLSDAAGNTAVLDADQLPNRGFEVLSRRDEEKPRLSALEPNSRRIDVSLAAVDVQVGFTATDDLSGVSSVELSFANPSETATRSGTAKFAPAETLSGSVTVTFPRQSEPGLWTLKSIVVTDAAGNTLVLDGSGFPASLEVISQQDKTPPQLLSLELAQDAIDTRLGSASVDVAFRASDNLSGLQSLQLTFVSPSGVMMQSATATFSSLKEVSDSIRITFPKQSESGRWRLGSLFLADTAGNTTFLDASTATLNVR